MRLALCQFQPQSGDPQTNLALMRERALAASDKGAQMLVFPETCITGYNIGEAMNQLAQPANGTYAETLTAMARETGLIIIAGYPEFHEQAVYNSAVVVGPDGVLGNARKTHLYGPGERKLFRPGDALSLVRFGDELDGLSVGLLICYDIEFPEAARALALAGAQLIVTPTAVMEPYFTIPDILVPIRAWENSVFVAYANLCGREGDLTYCGKSCVVNPMGEVMARAPQREEALLIVDLDLAELEQAREINPYLADRRDWLYEQAVFESSAPALLPRPPKS